VKTINCFTFRVLHVSIRADELAIILFVALVRYFLLRKAVGVFAVFMTLLCICAAPAYSQDPTNVVNPAQNPAPTQDTAALAKAAQNPIAKMISIPIENDFNLRTGVNKEDSYVLQLKPVIPFTLSEDWTVITRTIVPVIQLPSVAQGVGSESGLGDIQESLFFSPAKAHQIIWGAGPVFSVPSATDHFLGSGKFSVGPTAVALTIQGHWLYGILGQNLWSVAGPSGRADVNQMLLQPFVNYNLPHGWYLTSSPVITANWKADSDNRWLLPLGGGFGKIFHIGKLPINTYLQAFSNVERPHGTSPVALRFQVQFLFPK
jgi:hypothetical protein